MTQCDRLRVLPAGAKPPACQPTNRPPYQLQSRIRNPGRPGPGRSLDSACGRRCSARFRDSLQGGKSFVPATSYAGDVYHGFMNGISERSPSATTTRDFQLLGTSIPLFPVALAQSPAPPPWTLGTWRLGSEEGGALPPHRPTAVPRLRLLSTEYHYFQIMMSGCASYPQRRCR